MLTACLAGIFAAACSFGWGLGMELRVKFAGTDHGTVVDILFGLLAIGLGLVSLELATDFGLDLETVLGFLEFGLE